MNAIISREILTDNGVTKEFDPLRNSKEERSKTPQTSQQIKCKCHLFHKFIMLDILYGVCRLFLINLLVLCFKNKKFNIEKLFVIMMFI